MPIQYNNTLILLILIVFMNLYINNILDTIYAI